MSYNFKHSVSILHDSNGILKPLSPKQYDVYRTIGKRAGKKPGIANTPND